MGGMERLEREIMWVEEGERNGGTERERESEWGIERKVESEFLMVGEGEEKVR